LLWLSKNIHKVVTKVMAKAIATPQLYQLLMISGAFIKDVIIIRMDESQAQAYQPHDAQMPAAQRQSS
jgi:hypothetical protein